MLCQHGPAAARRADGEPKQEKYKSKPNMEARNAQANFLKAVIWEVVQVSQSLFINFKGVNHFPFVQSTVLCLHGPAVVRRADQEPKEEVYKSKPNMEARNAQANFLKAVTWEAVQVSQSFL